MYDEALVQNILRKLSNACRTILVRFESVESVDDFTGNPQGMEKLDSICMLLIAIGESLKNLDKVTDRQLLNQYPQVDWKKAKGLRDIISHHYFDVNAEAIFDVCQTKIATMADTLEHMLKELK
jgi:uncharacterized protein with HEPN domain